MGWPDLTYRSRLEPQLRNELDQLVSLIVGWNAAEHGADGQHTTITVDGIQFRNAAGDIIASIVVEDGRLVFVFAPTTPPSAGPGVQIDDVLIATHEPLRPTIMGSGIDLNTDAAPEGADLAGGRWCIAAAKDGLFTNALVFGNRAGNAPTNISNYIALYYGTNPAILNGYALCPPAAGGGPGWLFKLGLRSDSRLRWDEINGKAIDASLGYTERGRTVPLGEWIDVPYNAANFTGAGAMVVTVDAADQLTFAYTVVGRTMTVLFYFAPITVSGAAGPTIFVKIPDGYLAARYSWGALAQSFDNGVLVQAMCRVDAAGTQMQFQRQDGTPWNLSANNTYLVGQVTFSVQ